MKLEGYEGVKAQLLQNDAAAMIVVTQSAHMVVVFLLCHAAFRGIPACLNS